MDELHDRFHRLDRVATPDLWREAVGRAAELELAPRRPFNPMLPLIAALLLMAALAGTIAVGSWVNKPEVDPLSTVYSNGVLAATVGCGGIAAIDPETSQVTELVTPAADASCGGTDVSSLAWSADGHWLAYVTAQWSSDETEAPTTEVRIRDARDGTERLVQSCTGCTTLDISPDGSLVTYVDGEWEGDLELVVARTDGSAVHRVPFVGSPGEPAFSPDGKTIAIPITGGTSGVHVLDVAGLDDGIDPTMRLLHGPVASSHVSWSPDGQWLAFDKQANGDYSEIWAVRTYGTDARLLAAGPGPDGPSHPVWSADSSTVAFISEASGDATEARALELWTAGLDGETNRIYRSSCCYWDGRGPITWSPDGEWIAFGIQGPDDAAESGIYLLRPDGSDLHRLSPFAGQPAWQPIPQD